MPMPTPCPPQELAARGLRVEDLPPREDAEGARATRTCRSRGRLPLRRTARRTRASDTASSRLPGVAPASAASSLSARFRRAANVSLRSGDAACNRGARGGTHRVGRDAGSGDFSTPASASWIAFAGASAREFPRRPTLAAVVEPPDVGPCGSCVSPSSTCALPDGTPTRLRRPARTPYTSRCRCLASDAHHRAARRAKSRLARMPLGGGSGTSRSPCPMPTKRIAAAHRTRRRHPLLPPAEALGAPYADSIASSDLLENGSFHTPGSVLRVVLQAKRDRVHPRAPVRHLVHRRFEGVRARPLARRAPDQGRPRCRAATERRAGRRFGTRYSIFVGIVDGSMNSSKRRCL